MTEIVPLPGSISLTCHFSGDPSAPPMLALHGLGESGADWDIVADAFGQSFYLIAPDMRGHADSEWPGDYSYELMRDDVLALMDTLGLDDVVLVGHSMGAAVAWLLVQTAPERFNRLVIEDGPPPYEREMTPRERPDTPLPFDWDVALAIWAATNDPERRWWRGLPDLSMPTLVIGGGKASTIPQDIVAEAAALVPRAEFVTIEAGHHVHTWQTEQFTQTVLTWLDANPPR